MCCAAALPAGSATVPGQDTVQVRAGVGLPLPFQLAMKPKAVELPAPTAPFHGRFFAVTAVADWVTLAPHAWLICCPPPKAKPVLHPAIVLVPVFLTLTSAWKPPLHWLVIR